MRGATAGNADAMATERIALAQVQIGAGAPDSIALATTFPALATGQTGTLRYTYGRPVEDFDASANDADFPPEWTEALAYGLAVRLAPRFGKAAASMLPAIAPLAQSFYATLKGFQGGSGDDSLRGAVRINLPGQKRTLDRCTLWGGRGASLGRAIAS